MGRGLGRFEIQRNPCPTTRRVLDDNTREKGPKERRGGQPELGRVELGVWVAVEDDPEQEEYVPPVAVFARGGVE